MRTDKRENATRILDSCLLVILLIPKILFNISQRWPLKTFPIFAEQYTVYRS